MHSMWDALPDERTSFIGRRDELAALKSAASSHRLITVIGAPGVGKSRLVIHHLRAARRPPGFRLTYVNGSASSGPRPTSATESELLVVDDADDIDDIPAWVDETLTANADLRIIVTRQRRLAVAGEVLLPLGPLPFTRRGSDLALPALARDPAVRLLLERASASAPGFALSEGNARDVWELCALTDGVPGAIEAVATALRAHSPARVRDVYEAAGQGRAVPLSEGGVSRAVARAFARCTPDARALWCAAATLRGSFGLDLVAATGGFADTLKILDLVTELVDDCILEVVRFDDDVRYRMLSPLRTRGMRAVASDGSLPLLRARTLAKLVDVAAEAGRELFSENQARWFDRIGRDQETILDAIRSHLEQDDADPEPVMLILSDLRMFWIAQSEVTTALHLLARVLEGSAGHPHTRRRALWTQAYLAVFAGQSALARQSVADCRRADTSQRDLDFLDALIALDMGAHDEAWDAIRKALDAALLFEPGRVAPVVGEVFYYAALIALVRADYECFRAGAPCRWPR